MSAGDALSLSMVYRAVQIISVAVMQMSFDAYRANQILEPAPAFIRLPDPNSTRSTFLEQTTVSLAVNGNAFWRVTRDNQSRVTALEVLNPLDVEIQHTQSGRVTGYQHFNTVLRPTDVQHLALMRVPGQVRGLGPIQAAQSELRGAIDVRDYGSNWFETSGVPSGILSTPQALPPGEDVKTKARWNEQTAGGVRVVSNGLTYTPLFLSPKDAQFLESQTFTVTQLARLFGVPSSLMLATVEGNTQTYANVAQDWLGFTRFGLSRYTREIEEAFSSLLPRGTDARFNFEALLRSDTETRFRTHEIGLRAGFITVNEVRAIEKLAPLPGGDELSKPAPAPAPTDAAEEAES
ncbi:MAG: phage portal protein [Cryobacterium sp.]|nr:phage portal protein [Cryobacterium sp.]